VLHWLMGRARQARWPVVAVSVLVLVAITGLSTTASSPWPSQLSTPDLVKNADQSVRLWARLQRGLSGEAYAQSAALKLEAKPEVHIYIVESYGRILNRNLVRAAWKQRLSKMGSAFREDGWFMATGLSQAPVSGGRSWLADTTVFTGIEVKYESVYRHLVPQAATMPSLIRMFEGNGYRTILVRPKDRARKGVKLINHFDFEQTIFFKDLAYTGRSYGWSGIPDQFTLGKLREEILPADPSRPNFLFFHMASSHIPWNELPPVVDDWRELQHTTGKSAKRRRRSNAKEVKFQLARYKRTDEVRINRLRATTQNLGQYAKAIDYELQVLTKHVLALPEQPSMIILMGDHQPPMMGKSSDFSVPIHVLTRDPLLRREFIDRGFTRGMQLQLSTPNVRHEGLFSVISRALALNDGVALPPYLPMGAVQGPDQGEPPAVKTDKVPR
jgi:hypothetical protein